MHRDPDANVRLFYWRVAKIKAFKATVQLFEGRKVVASKTVEVNEPLKYKGYTIYQSSYDKDHEQFSVFEIARDPGVPFVYLGFLIISVGVMFSFYLRPLLMKRARVRGAADQREESEPSP
jgi:cytochrome c biogenesis protein ResB